MNLFKKVVLLFALCISVAIVNAQQDPQFTQYMYNTMTVNPAYAGSQGRLVMTLLGRTQWVGMKDAPETQSLTFDTPLHWKGVGLGIGATNDKVGPANEIYLDANISYAIKTSEKGRLALGLKLGSRLLNIDADKLNAEKDVDANLNSLTKAFATVGAGLFFYTDKYYLGVSVPNMLPSDHFDATSNEVSAERFHLFTITGYVFDLNDKLKLKPAALLKLVSGAPISLDVSTNLLINEKFNVGASWRWDDSFSTLLGFYISDSFHIGYAYDMMTSSLRNTNRGTHEIVLRYNFKRTENNNAYSVKSNRFF